MIKRKKSLLFFENRAAKILQKNFLKLKKESDAAYSNMLTKGEIWKNYIKNTATTLGYKGATKAEFSKLCKKNRDSLFLEVVSFVDDIPILEEREAFFLEKVLNQPLYAVHVAEETARENIENTNSIGLFSRQLLQKKKIPFDETHTEKLDIKNIAADNFVYFSLGLSEKVRKPSSRFGTAAYNIKIEEVKKFESGFFTLYDPAGPEVTDPKRHIDNLSDEGADILYDRKNDLTDSEGKSKVYDFIYPIGEKGIYIKEVLALAIIRDTRLLKNEEDRKLILESQGENDEAFSEKLEKIITALYRPQLIVPRHLYVARNGKGNRKKVGKPQKIERKIVFKAMPPYETRDRTDF